MPLYDAAERLRNEPQTVPEQVGRVLVLGGLDKGKAVGLLHFACNVLGVSVTGLLRGGLGLLFQVGHAGAHALVDALLKRQLDVFDGGELDGGLLPEPCEHAIQRGGKTGVCGFKHKWLS